MDQGILSKLLAFTPSLATYVARSNGAGCLTHAMPYLAISICRYLV